MNIATGAMAATVVLSRGDFVGDCVGNLVGFNVTGATDGLDDTGALLGILVVGACDVGDLVRGARLGRRDGDFDGRRDGVFDGDDTMGECVGARDGWSDDGATDGNANVGANDGD
jgi:hypothetical protein